MTKDEYIAELTKLRSSTMELFERMSQENWAVLAKQTRVRDVRISVESATNHLYIAGLKIAEVK